MFAPIAPIQSDSRSDAAVEAILARIDAISTILHVLARMTGGMRASPAHTLDQRVALSARLAGHDAAWLAHLGCELDAVAAMLQTGFAALDHARKQGHRATAAAALLHREAADGLETILAVMGSEHPRV